MTGIERLRTLAAARDEWVLGGTIADIADQIERERECERDTIENLRLELGEARDDAAWVREHGGLESVKERLDWVVGHCSTKQQLDFDFWLSGRVMHELGFDEDMADSDEVERRLLARLMPEGMEWLLEVWPKWSNGEYCKFGDWWKSDKYGEPEPKQFRKLSIYTPEQLDEWEQGDGESYGYEWDFMRPSELDYRPDKVEPPAPKVLDADGEEIREKRDVWWICEGDERGVHAGRLRVETICPNGLIECSPYNGGTWVHLKPSELYVNKPVPSSDGRPLREGETVWHMSNKKFVKITGFTKNSLMRDVVDVEYEDGSTGRYAPNMLTHERTDSWERLEEDARLKPSEYTDRYRVGRIGFESEDMRADLVRRCRALAGVE